MGRAFRTLALLLFAAAVAVEARGGDYFERNLVVDAGLALALASALALRGRARDLPFPRPKRFAVMLIVCVAIANAMPTLSIPYLSDDYAHLERARMEPTPFHAWVPDGMIAGQFLRPVAWTVWWSLERIAPNDAWPAHALCAALFAVTALLVVPALRRTGVPRGIAVAAAALFAASPIAVEVLAWVSNLYSLLSLVFALAAIATLPVRRPTARAFVVPAAFTLLSLLSKEDTVGLPVLLVLVGARFRWRRLRAWIVPAWPAFAALGAVIAARFAIFGGVGGYLADASGNSVFLSDWREGLERELTLECPARFVLPTRDPSWLTSQRWLTHAIALVPAALLALGIGSRAAAMGAVRGVSIAALGLAPVFATLWLSPNLGSTRLLFFPSVGIALIAAACLSGAPLRRRFAWLLVVALACASIAIGRSNVDAWRRAGEALERCVASATKPIRALPTDATVLIYGLPGQIDGAYAFTGAVPFAFTRAADRRDVSLVDRTLGRFGAVMEFDPALQAAADPLRGSGRTLELDATTTLHFRRDDASGAPIDRSACRLLDGTTWEEAKGEWTLWPFSPRTVLLLPTIHVPGGAVIRVHAAGGTTARDYSAAGPVHFAALYRDGASIVRRELDATGSLELPAGSHAVRFEVLIDPDRQTVLDSIDVSARRGDAR